MIEEVLRAMGVATAAAAGFEADDVIGTLTARSAGPVDVVTGDRDLFQLVDDRRPVRIVYTARGLTKLDVVDEAAVTQRYGIPGRAYADFAVLRGDPSDGLPGVPGVGEKTAAALVQAFGSIDAITDALDRGHGGFPKGSRAKVAAARDYLAVAMPVVRVAPDAPGARGVRCAARRPGRSGPAGRARRTLGPGLVAAPGGQFAGRRRALTTKPAVPPGRCRLLSRPS